MNEVEEIKEKLDIVEVISSYLTLKKAGTNYKASCPFHNEKTPSFMVSPERQTFKCFGCNEGGDIYSFIEKMEGVDFFNALNILADRAGVKLKRRQISYDGKTFQADSKTRLFEINEWAAKVFHKILIDHQKAKIARDYLKERGLNSETWQNFQIGYAPNSWDFLIKFLDKKGYSQKEVYQAGAAVLGKRGDYYDRFRGRIIYPISNVMGKVVGFASRVLEDKEGQGAKYINSSDSPIYHKGKILYGLNLAKVAIRENNFAVLVEGNMDVIACHQAGFKNVVASSGTAITEEQLTILSRYAEEIAFSFDRDEAGWLAMKKAVILALQNDISCRIIFLPEKFKDPDEAIKADPKNWQNAVKKSCPALEFWIDGLVEKNPYLSIADKKKIAKEILPVIKLIYSEIEKEHYIKYLADKLSVSEKALAESLGKTKNNELNRELFSKETKIALSNLERIAGVIWNMPMIVTKISQEDTEVLFKSSHQGNLNSFYNLIKSGDFAKERFSRAEKNQLEDLAIMIANDYDSLGEDEALAEVGYLINNIKHQKFEKTKSEFAKKIKEAEQAGDREKMKKLLLDFQQLIK